MINGQKYYNKFYCSVCDAFLSGSGSNMKSHLNTFKHNAAIDQQDVSPLDSFIIWMLKHNVPLNSINDTFFHMFLLESFTYKKVTERLEELYSILINDIIKILERQENIVLIADGWTDKRLRRYLGLGTRYIENETIHHIFLGLNDIPEVIHNADNVSQCIQKNLDRFNIDHDKISSFFSDSAPVMPAIAEKMGFEWAPCFIHLFNNCIRDFVEGEPSISSILSKANSLRKQEVFVSFLESKMAPISSIKKYSKTRWMTCFETLKSISQLKDYIQEYFEMGNEELFTEEELETVDLILPFFQSLNEAYEFLLKQEDEVFSSMIFNVLNTVIKMIDAIDNEVIEFKTLKDMLLDQFLNADKKSCCCIMYATILDKSYKLPKWFRNSFEYKSTHTIWNSTSGWLRPPFVLCSYN